jgi:hypothetical protein
MGFRITLPETYVVHLGNSQELMLAADDAGGRASARQRVRRMVGIHDTDVVFAMINSMFSTLVYISTQCIL